MATLSLPGLQAADNIKKVKSTIQQVTVFLNGAQVTREATTSLVAGTQTIKFSGLSAELDPGSVQVRGDGRFSILAVSSEMFYPEVDQPEVPQAEIDQLVAERARLQKELKFEESMLNALRGGTHSPGRYRALAPRNHDAWYKAFDVKPGDELYLAPEERAKIW